MKPANTRLNFLILAVALVVLTATEWAGLLRIGWNWPTLHPNLAVSHGPLMVAGFFGALISLERAVAMRDHPWSYLAPIFSGFGSLLLTFGVGGVVGPTLMFLGSLVLVAIFIVILRQQFLPYTITMAIGALALAIGNGLWLFGGSMFILVHWWMGFLVLTIVGERLELSRIVSRSRFSTWSLVAAALIYLAGLFWLLGNWTAGVRLASVGLLLLALWLMRYDIARWTVRKQGLTRFIAICLLGGYVWMAVSGAIGLIYPPAPAGPVYDAMLHAIFLGFTFTMIFGHAPIIFPAVLGLKIRYRPTMYIPLVSLHLSLIIRILGDLLMQATLRRWGGLLNVLVIIGYFWMIAPVRKINRESEPILPGM